MLTRQTINIPFGVGIDEKMQEEILDPSVSMLTLRNVRIDKTGAYHKRNGYAEGIPLSSRGVKLGQLNTVPFLIDSEELHTYSPLNGFTSMGRVPECIGTRAPAANALATLLPNFETNYDLAYANNVTVVATLSSLTAFDARSGAVIVQAGRGVGTLVRCVVVGRFIVILFGNGSGTGATISHAYLDTNNLALGFQGFGDPPLVTDAQFRFPGPNLWGMFDAVQVTGATFAIAYGNDSGNFEINVKTFNPTSTVPIAQVTIPSAGSFDIISTGVGCNVGDILWVTWAGRNDLGPGNTVAAIALDPASLATVCNINYTMLFATGGDLKNLGVVPTTTANAIIVGSDPEPFANFQTSYMRADATGATVAILAGSGGQTNIWRHQMVGKPFQVTSVTDRYYLPLVARHTPLGTDVDLKETEPTCILADITDTLTVTGVPTQVPRPVCIIAPRLVDLAFTPKFCASSVAVSANQIVSLVTTQTNDVGANIEFTTYDFNSKAPNLWQNDEINGSSILSGGMLYTFDTQNMTEVGFERYPEYLILTAGVAGNVNGTVSYVAIYEWTTSTGDIVRSAPCPVTQITGVTNQQVTVRIPTLQLTAKDRYSGLNRFVPLAEQVRIVVYRTTDAGSIYYRVGSIRNQSSASIGQDTLMLVDNVGDLVLQTNELLYTQPGTPGTALPKFVPPSASSMVIHRNRVFMAGDDGVTIWYSGQIIPGEQPWFNDQFTLQVPKGGPITALESMDGVLYAFKRDFIFSITGDGPADNNTGNDLTTPEEMDIEVGCIEPRSTVVSPGGIFFQSPRGMYMLTRSRTVVYAGHEVEETLKAFPVIVSSDISDLTGCILWECISQETGTQGLTIVYDYVHDKWMTDLKTDSETGFSVGAHAGEVINGIYYWATLGGLFNIETTGVYLDAGRWYSVTIETAWMKLAGLQGFERVRQAVLLAAKQTGDHGISLTAWRNYDDLTPFQTASWSNLELSALTTPRQQLELNLSIQKMESLKLRFSDIQPTDGVLTGEGPIWIGLAIEVGVKQGTFKMPSANSK